MSDQPVPIDILLVEDDPSDVLLTKKALTKAKFFNSLNVAVDGIDALSFLKREGNYADAPRPDLILLDLNMPRMDGREFLAAIKADDDLKRIPVVVLTTSDADQDVIQTYNLQASCYITKPVGLDAFKLVVGTIQNFWMAVVKYPGR